MELVRISSPSCLLRLPLDLEAALFKTFQLMSLLQMFESETELDQILLAFMVVEKKTYKRQS